VRHVHGMRPTPWQVTALMTGASPPPRGLGLPPRMAAQLPAVRGKNRTSSAMTQGRREGQYPDVSRRGNRLQQGSIWVEQPHCGLHTA